eukprot:9783438-Alexandrium_andersonii.AAC.1
MHRAPPCLQIADRGPSSLTVALSCGTVRGRVGAETQTCLNSPASLRFLRASGNPKRFPKELAERYKDDRMNLFKEFVENKCDIAAVLVLNQILTV